MKRKEKVDLEVETQRLFDKAEKEHKKHQDYLRRQADREERESARYEMELKFEEREAEREKIREAYKKTPEGRLEQFRTDERKAEKYEKTRNWNTPESINERKRVQEEWEKHLKEEKLKKIERDKKAAIKAETSSKMDGKLQVYDLGYINCDKFYDEPTMPLFVSIDEKFTAEYYLVYTDIRGVMKGDVSGPKVGFGSIAKNREAYLIGVSYVDKQAYYFK